MSSVPTLAIRPSRNAWLLTALLFAVFTLICCLQKPADFQKVYVVSARHLLANEDIFRDAFVYPPFSAVLALPWTQMDALTGRIVYGLLNGLAAVVLLGGAWHLAGGKVPFQFRHLTRTEAVILTLGVLGGFGYVFDSLASQQTDLIIGAVVIGGCCLLKHGRAFPAAVLIGLAAAVKCTPLLFAPYLAWRRQWLASITVVVLGVGMNFTPELIRYSETGQPRVVNWVERFLLTIARNDVPPGMWASAIEYNHSLAGMTNRVLAWERTQLAGSMAGRSKADAPSPVVLKRITYGITAGLLVLAMFVTRRGNMMSMELSMVLLLMLVMSPMSSKPHFCTLLLPLWCLARWAVERGNRLVFVGVLVAAVVGLMTNKDLVGRTVYDFGKWYGLVTIQTLLLLLTCIWVRHRSTTVAQAEVITPPIRRAA